MFDFLWSRMGGSGSLRVARRDRAARARRRRDNRASLGIVDLEERVVPSNPGSANPAALLGLPPVTRAAALSIHSDGQDYGPPLHKSMDDVFLYAAARGQEQEILLGSLATQIGSSEGVRDFGWQLAGDHALGLAQLVPVLNDAGLSLPGMMPDQRQIVVQFNSLTGAEFDQQFAAFMVQDHKDDIAMFKDEIRNGQNPEAVAYAQQNLPVLKEHLHIAKRLQRQLGGGDPGPGNGQTPPPGSSPDRDFLLHAARGNQQEIVLGAMATRLGSYDGVVAFGGLLVSDHAGGLVGIIPILTAGGLNVPRLDPMQRDTISCFAFLTGDAFDRAFVDFMVQDHEDDIARFEDEAHNGQDLLARNYAVQALPILRDHLNIALELQQQLEGGGPRGTGGDRGASEPVVLPGAVRSLYPAGTGGEGHRVPIRSGGAALRPSGVPVVTPQEWVAARIPAASAGEEAPVTPALMHGVASQEVVFSPLGLDLIF